MTNLINETGHYTLPSTWSRIRFYVFMEISVVQAFHIYVCIVGFFSGWSPVRISFLSSCSSESKSYTEIFNSRYRSRVISLLVRDRRGRDRMVV